MATLDLFKQRQTHSVLLDINGTQAEYKIPTEYTVEEVERLLEYQVVLDETAKKEVDDNDSEGQLNTFFDALFNQLVVLFSRYQPEVTLEFLKKHLTRKEASEIITFYANEQLNVVREKSDIKKKAQKSN